MRSEIICPYCGNIMKMKISANTDPDVVCELCGSPLKDEVIKAKQDIGQNAARDPFMSPPSNQVAPHSFGNPPANPSGMPSFPVSQIARGSAPPFPDPSRSDLQQALGKPPSGSATLNFPQIKQKITILSHEDIFHFGRNTILPLVNPANYDVEWLNSISRVQKDASRRIHRQHFMITKDSRGNYAIEDQNSRWGTWVNKHQIKGKGGIKLNNGDKIELMLSKPNVKAIFPFTIEFTINN